MTITQERLKELLAYDPLTGVFTWLIRPRHGHVKPGDIAGCLNGGYVVIRVDGRPYKAHRLAWLYMTGCFPSDEIDHINRIKDDNRIANLREASHAENAQNKGLFRNNKSGHKGVSWNTKEQKWFVQICVNGEGMYLGIYECLEAARQAYVEAAARYHTHNPVAHHATSLEKTTS